MRLRQVKQENVPEEEHDVEMDGWDGYVKSDQVSRTLRMRSCRAKTKSSSQTPSIGGVSKKVKKLKDKKQSSVTFETILRTSSSPGVGSSATLTIPAWFIKAHGDKLRQSVVLRDAVTKTTWTVHLAICYPRNVPQVKFAAGWREFVVYNGLDEGDLLMFCLWKPSQFDVHMHRKVRGSDESVLPLRDSELPSRKKLKMVMRVRSYEEKHTKAKRISDAEPIAKLEQVTDDDANPKYLPFISVPTQRPGDLPCFFKRMVASNLHDAAGYASGASLEIPRKFATRHRMQLRSSVELWGLSEDSPVHAVACRTTVQLKQTRLYLRAGWSGFVSDNNLRLGQVLVFTLTANSTFAVKEAPYKSLR